MVARPLSLPSTFGKYPRIHLKRLAGQQRMHQPVARVGSRCVCLKDGGQTWSQPWKLDSGSQLASFVASGQQWWPIVGRRQWSAVWQRPLIRLFTLFTSSSFCLFVCHFPHLHSFPPSPFCVFVCLCVRTYRCATGVPLVQQIFHDVPKKEKPHTGMCVACMQPFADEQLTWCEHLSLDRHEVYKERSILRRHPFSNGVQYQCCGRCCKSDWWSFCHYFWISRELFFPNFFFFKHSMHWPHTRPHKLSLFLSTQSHSLSCPL